jgi:hypothetical protein
VSPEEATKSIAEARAKDEFAYVSAVAEVLGEADRLRWFPWRRGLRVKLFQVVAVLDGDDKLIAEGVDEARRFLEKRGIPCEPSVERWYEKHLESKTPFERHLMLAKQAMLGGAANGSDSDRTKALHSALHHYEMAGKHGALSRKQSNMVSQLRKRLDK